MTKLINDSFPRQKSCPHSTNRGFALVVTLSLMVLLSILAVGMLSLSSVSLRASSRGDDAARARANARLALVIAIGELQKHTGSDTRITASADILDATNPPLTGVWRSWEGNDHELTGAFAGRPKAPAYADKNKLPSANGRFLTWLVSGTGTATSPADAKKLVYLTALPATTPPASVPLVSSKSLASGDTRQVHLPPVKVGDQGAMAWWVSGENQKARLPQHQEPADTTSAWTSIANSHAVADPQPFGLDSLLTNPAPATKAITRESSDLLGASAKPSKFFHDLSANSVGLLTNTATGGWRKDLSLLTENWDNQPMSGLPLFRISPKPGDTSSAKRPDASNPTPTGPSGVMLYPWAEFPATTGTPITRIGASSSWANLVDHALHYRRVSAGGQPSTPLVIESVFNSAKIFEFHHRTRVFPLCARVQWVFSHASFRVVVGANPLFQPRLVLTPVVTMWNPYNVQITAPTKMPFVVAHALPAALRYYINGAPNPSFNSLTIAMSYQPPLTTGSGIDFNFAINGAFTLLPGETRVFSPTTPAPAAHSTTEISLTPGYRAGSGYFFQVRGASGTYLTNLPGTTRIKADAAFDTEDQGGTPPGPRTVGVYFDIKGAIPALGTYLVYRMNFPPATARAVYPPLTDLAEATLSSCENNPLPFLSTVFGARTASNTHLAAKGFVQSSPLVNFTQITSNSVLGSAHPVNSPFDYSFVKHAGAGDSKLPNAQPSTNRGYIVTGFTAADGLSRSVIAELPLQALSSLGDLTHWDARFENPAPPYSFNIIGNSDASPLIPANAVFNSNNAKTLQYDASYCSNHLLFDDWFFSSIAPDSKLPGTASRDQKNVYLDFVSGKTPLVNRAYRAIAGDTVATPAEGDPLFTQHVSPTAAWQTIASHLEVEGMFNVNSTSVTAWRALLGHARNQRVPYTTESSIALSGKSDYVLNRFSVAGDTKAGTAGISGAFPEATEFSGYRTVDDPFLDELAKEVVKQIRSRGPFLSLSEFVNRQLTGSNTNLALAGTIQAALNELSKSPSTDLYKNLKSLSTVSVANPPSTPAPGRDEEYQFREAAVGYSSYGLPGWTRQVDVLRPLAPILSARDDTFTIRTYGDARDKDGNILAKAWCEATVRRTRDFVDPAEAADRTDPPALPANQTFGRRYEMISFRWLSQNEI